MASFEKGKLKSEYLNGSYRELADLLGIDAVLNLHAKYRGTQIFLPVELLSREYIASEIVREYNGHNVRHLATKYGYTEKWVRKILKDNSDSSK